MNTDRLAQLEQQAAKLNAEIAALKSGSGRQDKEVAPRAIVQEEGVRISTLLTERTDLPNLKEMERLFEIVKRHAPWPQAMRGRFSDEGQPFRSFCSAFRWIMNKGRVEHPNNKIDLSYWIDEARVWLRSRNSLASDLDANGLVLAALACGDVAYVVGDGRLGTVWELSLAQHGGRPASPDAWKRVLLTGEILPPSPPARSVTVVPSNVRIYWG
jgi:hypothetical protein